VSTSAILGPLHFRGALRLGLDWRKTPFKNYAGLRFYDSTGTFPQLEIHRRGEYVHRFREARWEIHNYARTSLVKNVIDYLTAQQAKHTVMRELVDGHRVEIHQIIHNKTCVLLVLRNWVNPLHDIEITRIVKALEKYSRRIRDKYEHIWKYILAPTFEKAQTKLERFHGIQLYDCLPYILPKSLTAWLAQKTSVDYSYAYPSQERWPSGLTELFRATLGRLLGLRACTPTPAPVTSLSTPAGALVKTHTLHIDPITSQTPPEPPRSPVFDRGPPTPCTRTPPSPSTMKIGEDGSALAPTSLLSLFASLFYPLIPDTLHTLHTPSKQSLFSSSVDYSKPVSERAKRINVLYAYALEHAINSEKHLTYHAMQHWGIQKRSAREYAQLVIYRLHRLDKEAA